MSKIMINATVKKSTFKTAIRSLLISSHNSFRVLSDKTASVNRPYHLRIDSNFSVGNGQPNEPGTRFIKYLTIYHTIIVSLS